MGGDNDAEDSKVGIHMQKLLLLSKLDLRHTTRLQLHSVATVIPFFGDKSSSYNQYHMVMVTFNSTYTR